MKDSLIVGDTLDFVTDVPDFPPSAGYTMKYRLIPQAAGVGVAILLTASATAADTYRVEAYPVTTATWTPAEYTESAWVEKSGDRHTVDGALLPFRGSKGLCTVLPDPALVASYDGRSPARAALDAANAALAGYGTSAFSNVAEYSINGRSMRFREFRDQGDFLAYRSRLAAEVWREDAAAKMAAGQPNPRQIRIRTARA